MYYLLNYSGHIRLYMESKFAQKLAKDVFKRIIVGNGQITLNFFDFQKFCVNLYEVPFVH